MKIQMEYYLWYICNLPPYNGNIGIIVYDLIESRQVHACDTADLVNVMFASEKSSYAQHWIHVLVETVVSGRATDVHWVPEKVNTIIICPHLNCARDFVGV